jgi:excisionase family DNA binding protein
MTATSTPRQTPLLNGKQLYKITEAMHLLSMSRAFIYKQLDAGRLRSVKQGRARYIPAAAITDYVALLELEAASEVVRRP